jgi:hypothetical protein
MSRPTFSAEVLVRIEIKGIPRKDPAGERTLLPDDRGLCRELFAWERAQHITPAYLILSGGGRYIGLYARDDAARITAWLSDRAERELWNQDEEITKPGAG